MRKKSGIVLVTVLWILLILSLLAMGLSFLGSGELSLCKISFGKLRAYAASRAGINYAVKYVLKQPSQKDVLGKTGIDETLDKKDPFADEVALGEGERFSIKFPAKYYFDDAGKKELTGIMDEMGRLNINSINSTASVAGYVFEDLANKFEPGSGAKLKESIIRFRSTVNQEGALRTFYFPEELLLVEGFSAKLFKKLKSYVTVYPYGEAASVFKINMYTAPSLVVKSVFLAVARQSQQEVAAERDAISFIQCRTKAVLGQSEPVERCALPLYLNNYGLGPFRSGIYRIRSVGTDDNSGARAIVETVIDVRENSVNYLSWHRE